MNVSFLENYFSKLRPSKIILISAIFGFFIGALCVPSWSAGVESAEVLSGLVKMPFDNPTFMYHSGVFSFWCIQLPALLLKLGVSTWQASIFSSGLECALAFAAISACTLVFFENALVAFLNTLLFTFIIYSTEHGYPVLFLPSVHHFGQMGMFSALLTLSLIALEMRFVGFLLLGLIPGIHGSLAIMAWTGVGIALIMNWPETWNYRKQILVPFGLGFAFTILAFTIQKLYFGHSGHVLGSAQTDELMQVFTSIWDPHRQPMKWINFRVDLCTLLYAGYELFVRKLETKKAEKFFLTAIVGITMIAVSYCVIYRFFTIQLSSSFLNTLLLKRWLNINSLLMPLMSMTLLGRLTMTKKSSLAAGLLVLMGLLIFFGPPSTLNSASEQGLIGQNFHGHHFATLFIDAFYYKRIYFEVCLLIGIAMSLVFRHEQKPRFKMTTPFTVGALAIAILLLLSTYIRKFDLQKLAAPSFEAAERLMINYSKHKAVGDGVVIPNPGAPLFLQVQSSQGLLIDPQAMMQITLSPRSIVQVEEIFKQVYGMSLRNPDDRPRMEEGKDLEGAKQLWEQRSVSEWQNIRRTFNATAVLSRQDWKLQLPVFEKNNEYVIYEIPN